jgi:hypothetical protein
VSKFVVAAFVSVLIAAALVDLATTFVAPVLIDLAKKEVFQVPRRRRP